MALTTKPERAPSMTHRAIDVGLAQRPAVGDHGPGKPVLLQPREELVEVEAAERLAAGHNHRDLPGVKLRRQVVEEAQPLLGRRLPALLVLAAPGCSTG